MPHLVERMHARSGVERKLSLLALFPFLITHPPALLPCLG
jgi:hypothetical protein